MLAGTGIAGGYAWWRSKRPLTEIRIELARAATAHENEVLVLEPIEHAIARTDGIASLRGEATETGVTLSAFFPASVSPELTLEHLRAYLQSTQRQLPEGTAPPLAKVVLPSQRYLLRAKEPLNFNAAGVVATTVCGARPPERTTVRIDLPKLAAFGLDLVDVHRTLAVERRAADPTELGMLLLRGSPVPVALRDVATVSAVPGRSDCDVFSLDGGPTAFHFVEVVKEHEAPVLQQAKVYGQTMLPEDGTLRVEIRFVEAATHEQRMRLMLGLLPAVRDIEGLALYGAVLRRGNGEIVFATEKASKPTSIDTLRTIVGRTPGVAWGGARGPLARGLRRVHVTVTDGLDGDLPKLESTAATLRQRVEAVPGIGARLADAPGMVPHTDVTFDPRMAKLAPADTAWLSKLIAGDDDAAIAIELPDWRTAAIDKVPLAAIATVKRTLEPARIAHVGLERAIELVWETTDPSVITRVKNALAGAPLVTVTLE